MLTSGSFGLIVTLLAISVKNTVADCQPTITSVEGRIAPDCPLCSGQLIFDEEFEDLDTNVWKHENRMSAVGRKMFK